MKYILLFLIVVCNMNAGWCDSVYYQQPAIYNAPVIAQPYYTLRYVPVIKQEMVMIPVVENGVFYYYYPSSRWVPQPAPWTPDPYSEWLRCRHSNYKY